MNCFRDFKDLKDLKDLKDIKDIKDIKVLKVSSLHRYSIGRTRTSHTPSSSRTRRSMSVFSSTCP